MASDKRLMTREERVTMICQEGPAQNAILRLKRHADAADERIAELEAALTAIDDYATAHACDDEDGLGVVIGEARSALGAPAEPEVNDGE